MKNAFHELMNRLTTAGERIRHLEDNQQKLPKPKRKKNGEEKKKKPEHPRAQGQYQMG